MVDSIAYRGLFYKRRTPRVFVPPPPPPPSFDYSIQNWSLDFEGDNRTNSALIGTPSGGSSETHQMVSTSANTISAGGSFNGHASIDWLSDSIWSSGQFILSDIISDNEFTLFVALDVKSISELGVSSYDAPTIIGDGGGGAYWDIGIFNDGVDDLVIAGIYDGGFKTVSAPITVGKHVIAFRLKGGVLSLSVDNGDFQTTSGVSSIIYTGNYISTFGTNDRADIEVARISASPIGFTDSNVQQAVSYLGSRYGITVAEPDGPAEPLGPAYIFVTTGQSLSVGCAAGDPTQTPVTPGPITGHYQNDNIWNDAHTGVRTPHSDWTLVAPKNPMRIEGANGTGWPFNCWYETPCAAMAERFGELGLNYTGHICAGQNGQPYSGIKKGGGVASYAGSIDEVQEMYTKLIALGHTSVIVAGIILIHGESDLGNTDYGPVYLPEMQADYEADCQAITGQTEAIPLYYNQPSAGYPTALNTTSNIHQQMIDAHNGTNLVLVGPKYAVEYISGDFHLSPTGTRAMGRSIATAIYAHRNGGFTPLTPTSVIKTSSTTIEVTFQGNGSSSLVFDDTYWNDNHLNELTEWVDGKGFEVTDDSGRRTISSVGIASNVVTITISGGALSTNPICSYAFTIDGELTPRRGQLRTSAGDWCTHFTYSVTDGGGGGGFDITTLDWEVYSLGDNLEPDGSQITAVAVGNSAGRDFISTTLDGVTAGGTFGTHDSVTWESKQLWSNGTYITSDIINPQDWSFVMIADLQSFSAVGSSYHDTPTLYGGQGGYVYWGIGIANVGGDDKVIAGCYEGGFKTVEILASTGKQVIQWRCTAGVQQIRINKGAWETAGSTVGAVGYMDMMLTNNMGVDIADADVAFLGVSKVAFDDTTFDDICDLAALEFGVTL